MEISRTDVWPQVAATTIQIRRHAAAAASAVMRIPTADAGTERALAAARALDELDHAVEASRAIPGGSLIPAVASAYSGYTLARAMARGAAGSRIGAAAHQVLAASELLAARDHMLEGAALHRLPAATEVDRQRATSLLDAAISDAASGFAFLDHPPSEGTVRAALALAKQNVEYRQPFDERSLSNAQAALEQAAGVSAEPVPVPPPSPAYVRVGSVRPAPPVPTTIPRVALDLPQLVLPPVPTFRRAVTH